jgi:hypothetical protein
LRNADPLIADRADNFRALLRNSHRITSRVEYLPRRQHQEDMMPALVSLYFQRNPRDTQLDRTSPVRRENSSASRRMNPRTSTAAGLNSLSSIQTADK